MQNGSTKKFQEINKAYKLINKYINSFKYRFTKEEFGNQHPFSMGDMEWLHKPIDI